MDRKIILFVLLQLVFALPVFADVQTEVRTRVTQVQTDDTSLPVPGTGFDKKGFVGEIVTNIFNTNGKILNIFVQALANLSSTQENMFLKWNGQSFVASQIKEISGKIGIGIDDPQTKLHVNGRGRFDNGVEVDGIVAIAGNNEYHSIYGTPTRYGYLQILNGANERGMYIGYGNGTTRMDMNLEKADTLYISGGNVGIGASAPAAALEVNGNVIAHDPTQDNHLATKAYVDSKEFVGSGVDIKYINWSLTANGWNSRKCPEGYSLISCQGLYGASTYNLSSNTYVDTTGQCNVYGSSSYSDRGLLVCMMIPGMLVNGQHTEDECTNEGGEVYAITSKIKICRFNAAFCPSDWHQYGNWSTTTNTPEIPANSTGFTTGTFPKTTAKCQFVQHPETWEPVLSYNSCIPSAHSWGNTVLETCGGSIYGNYVYYTWYGARRTGSATLGTTCYSGRNQIGCY